MWTVIRFAWLFYTGAHLNGKTYNDATWWRDASPRYRNRRLAYTWWRRKARVKRMGWRNACFWIPLILLVAFTKYPSYAFTALLLFSPLLAYALFIRGRILLFDPFTSGNSDGSVNQHWRLKRAIRERLHIGLEPKRKRPGLARRDEVAKKVRTRELTPSERRAVVAELAPSLDGEVPHELKLLMSPDDDG
jgi:hypothetical protein